MPNFTTSTPSRDVSNFTSTTAAASPLSMPTQERTHHVAGQTVSSAGSSAALYSDFPPTGTGTTGGTDVFGHHQQSTSASPLSHLPTEALQQHVHSSMLNKVVGASSPTESPFTASPSPLPSLPQTSTSATFGYNQQNLTEELSTWTSMVDMVNTSTPFPGYISPQNISFDIDFPELFFDNITDCGWNSTDCLAANATNVTDIFDVSPRAYWKLILAIFPVFTVFGNLLVVMSVYRENSLRNATNFFIVSLAVADILLGILVMPLAIYVEVNNGQWLLGNILCDAWVALDVMGCTASILNLTAISVDRFIAVTQPIRYAKQKSGRRVHVMMAVSWIVSIAISSPIALGMNYTEERKKHPNECGFYNSEFLICSSMGSFYIPCVIMVILYWRIFRAIHLRAKKQAMKMKGTKYAGGGGGTAGYKNVIENRAQTGARTSDGSGPENSHHRTPMLPHGSPSRTVIKNRNTEETAFNLAATTTDTGEEDSQCTAAELIKSPTSDDTDHVIPNDKSTEFMLSPVSEDNSHDFNNHKDGDSVGYSAPVGVEVETGFNTLSPTSPRNLLSPPPRKGFLGFRNHLPRGKKGSGGEESPRKSVTKFNFHMRHSKKKTKNLASKREKKATTTLAIVLGVFLFCWVPFFTVNVMRAICIRLDVMHLPECNPNPNMMSFFVWLGYINSFLNPVIYTIFNIEFRKAFKKLLSCKR